MSSGSTSDDNNDGGNGGKSGGRGGAKRSGGNDDKQGEELATKVLSIQSKRFYLDVKQNDRGRFIKFAEVAGGGKKSRIFMSMRTSNQFKEHLAKFISVIDNLPPTSENAEPALLHSESIINDKRRYYLDLRENNRGRFLRITQTSVQFGTRFSIAVPAQGVTQLRDALVELLNEYCDDTVNMVLPEARSLRSGDKTFYFDPGNNDRGNFLKISEVKVQLGIRNSITLSPRALPQFILILQDLQTKIGQLPTNKGGTNESGEGENSANSKNTNTNTIKESTPKV